MLNIENIIITPDILKKIAELDEFKGRWKAIENLAPERLYILKRVASIESVGSSTRIEGSKLTDKEVERLLSNLDRKSFATRDEQEVAGYADAMDIVFNEHSSITITENHIKQLHGILLKYSVKDQDHSGEYKKITNHVEAFDLDGKSIGVVFQTATPFETPIMMKKLLEWYNQQINEEKQHPLLLISIFIVVFLAIHPFKDGNGRLSRILTTLLLLHAGYTYVLYSSMESVIEVNKDGYYLALRHTQKTIRTKKQDWEPWILYFLRTMLKQKDNLATKIKEEQSLRTSLPALSRQILELVNARGDISIKEIEKTTAANRSTIKVHLKKLTEQGYLMSIGGGRGAHYIKK
ncbi:MAG: Fic family protein [Pseudomonadota bacterium]